MKKLIFGLTILASITSFANTVELLPNQTVAGYEEAYVNSDGSVTLVKPYAVFNGKKVLFNGRTAISADKETINATKIKIGWQEPNISYMYMTSHDEVVCQVALGMSSRESDELRDKRGWVTTAAVISLDKNGQINSYDEKGFAMGRVTCK